MDFVRRDLIDYLGSRHSAVGLILAWFGLPALIGGIWLAVAASDVSRWISVTTLVWGALALPLGFSMRRTKPPQLTWTLACLLYATGLVAISAMLFWKNING